MADYSDNTPRTLLDDIKDQQEVVRMLEARDEMNAAVHCTGRRLSPVTMAAQRVLATLEQTARDAGMTGQPIDYDTDGTKPHKFVPWEDIPEMCNVAVCKSDSAEDAKGHPIHAA